MSLLDALRRLFQDDSSTSSAGPSMVGCSRTWGDRALQGQSATHRGDDLATVFDRHGEQRRLGPVVGKGGEGTVRQLRERNAVLVKLYHPAIRGGNPALLDKLECMTALHGMRDDPRFAWPRILVFDHTRRPIGYAMRRVPGVMLQTLCQPQLVRERLSGWSRRDVILCARNFIDLVDFAHRRDVILGDVNPANFLLDPRTHAVYAIDCDSYQIRCGSRTFPCPVGIPMLLAPELLEQDFSRIARTVQHELFSVAVMLFRMFMLGLHPYSRVYGQDPVRNLQSGQCALGTGSGNRLPRGPWYNIWSHLPYYMKQLFIRTFRDGHRTPEERATLNEWKEALCRYESDLRKGWLNPDLIPAHPKSKDYKGKRAPNSSHAAATTITGGTS